MVAPALPDVLETLYQLTVADTALTEDLAVKLGPLRADLEERDAIGIGVDAGTEEGEPATITSTWALARHSDSFTITCVEQSFDGDDDLVAACRRATALVGVLEAVVERLVDAVGAVWSAEVVGHAYRPLRTEQGVLAVIESSVRVETMRQEQQP